MRIRFEALDAWRGIAALSVVLFHLHVAGSITEWSLVREAWLFVPFFFVLSGFVLMHGYGSKEQFNSKNMLIKRFWRIWPLHLTMLSVFIVFELGKLAAQSKGIHFTYPAFEAQNAVSEIIPNALLLQSWFNSFNTLSFDYTAWSISVEVGMYLILALILSLFSSNKLRVMAFGTIAVVAASVMLMSIDRGRVLAHSGLLGFSMGVLASSAYSSFDLSKVRLGKVTGTSLEVVALGIIFSVFSYPGDHKYMIAGLAFPIVLLIFSLEKGVISELLKRKPFQTLGKLSYSIYLVHPAIIFSLFSVLQITKTWTIMLPTVNAGSHITLRFIDSGYYWVNQLIPAIVLALTIVVSAFTYQLIELAGQKFGQSIVNKSKDNLRNGTCSK